MCWDGVTIGAFARQNAGWITHQKPFFKELILLDCIFGLFSFIIIIIWELFSVSHSPCILSLLSTHGLTAGRNQYPFGQQGYLPVFQVTQIKVAVLLSSYICTINVFCFLFCSFVFCPAVGR